MSLSVKYITNTIGLFCIIEWWPELKKHKYYRPDLPIRRVTKVEETYK